MLPWWASQISESQQRRGNIRIRTTAEATTYIESVIGYPAYVKPVAGSKGLGVTRVETSEDVDETFGIYESDRIRVAVVEAAVDMPDYRIVAFDGVIISAYLRQPLAVIGDG